MWQVGVPAASAYAKMAAEGLTPDDVNMFKAAMGEAIMVSPLYQDAPHVKTTGGTSSVSNKKTVGSEHLA